MVEDNCCIWKSEEPFSLEYGGELHPLQLAYSTWGELNSTRDNVLLIAHGLTANSDAGDWWGPLLGPGKLFDTSEYFIVCVNSLGSPYGSSSPLTYQQNGRAGKIFPKITIRDIVRSQKLLLDHLGVQKVQSVIGPSLGGMVALEWPLLFPEYIRTIVSLGSTAKHSPWCIGLSAAQRDAIKSDPAWKDGEYGDVQPENGLSLARKIAMISYRSARSFDQRFGRNLQDNRNDYFAVESYLDYQGEKLVERFDANCYLALTEIMDTHDIGRGRGGHVQAMQNIHQPSLIISIDTDTLYPVYEQQDLVEHLPNAEYYVIHSINGHDAFLIDLDQVVEGIEPFKEKYWNKKNKLQD